MSRLFSIRVVVAAIAVIGWSAAPAAEGGDAAAGKSKNAMCIGCHGIPGYKTAFPEVYHVPKLGGQQSGYIVSALRAYKSGQRSHPSMRAIAAGLSDQDMADLAAYYSADGVKAAAKPEEKK
jgi:cytochrome c553